MEPKVHIPAIFKEGHLIPQEERLAVRQKPYKLYIGIPKESSFQENRISLTPSSVATLINNGHRVVIETGAGEKSGLNDHKYAEAGAEIVYSKERVFKAHIILKVAPPTMEELELFFPNQIVFSPIHLPTITAEYLYKMRQKRIIALAWEYIKDRNFHNFPLVRTLSEMAGISAMLTAGELLSNANNGRGVLLGGISGIPSTKVVILGAGIVAEYATRTALGLGAEVRIFDNNIYKLKRLQDHVGRQLYTSAINPIYLKEELRTAEVAIGAIHSKSGRAPIVVNEDMVASMKNGSVIIDVSIDQGGCFATSRVTTHDNPTFRAHGVIHYCVPNIASRVSRTASKAVSNILAPLLIEAEKTGGIEQMIYHHLGLRNGIYIYKGALTNQYLGERFQIKSTDLDLLLPSRG